MAELLIFLTIIALYTTNILPKWLFITAIVVEALSIVKDVIEIVVKTQK